MRVSHTYIHASDLSNHVAGNRASGFTRQTHRSMATALLPPLCRMIAAPTASWQSKPTQSSAKLPLRRAPTAPPAPLLQVTRRWMITLTHTDAGNSAALPPRTSSRRSLTRSRCVCTSAQRHSRLAAAADRPTAQAVSLFPPTCSGTGPETRQTQRSLDGRCTPSSPCSATSAPTAWRSEPKSTPRSSATPPPRPRPPAAPPPQARRRWIVTPTHTVVRNSALAAPCYATQPASVMKMTVHHSRAPSLAALNGDVLRVYACRRFQHWSS